MTEICADHNLETFQFSSSCDANWRHSFVLGFYSYCILEWWMGWWDLWLKLVPYFRKRPTLHMSLSKPLTSGLHGHAQH